jgi:hypothetical protein
MQLGQVVGVHRLLDLGDTLEGIIDEFLNKNARPPISSSSLKVWMLIAGRFADRSEEGRGHARRKPIRVNGDIDAVFGSDHTGFQTRKSRLHRGP